MKTSLFGTLLFGTLFALASCGGGSSGTGGSGVTTFGTITGFGSVIVNGVEFSTSGAMILRDDVPVTQGDLRVGMVVTVSGTHSGSSGDATRIEVDDAVKGFVESISSDGSQWIVMGQTVFVDNQTRFENGVIPVVGNFVEVHGLVKADGVIAAGFVEKETAPGPAFEVKGFVKNHIDASKTFQIGALTVNYASAIINDMPNPATTSWNGLLVEAKGATCSGNPVCGTLTASKVEPNGPQMQDADEFEIEGFVTAVPPDVPSGSFKLGNQLVVTTGSTRFEGGVPTDIVVGVKLEVEGVLSGGILTAIEIEFRDSVRIEADIDTVTLGTSSFTLRGLPGITVTVNSLTQFEGSSVTGLNNLFAGDHVQVRGRASGANSVIATEVEKLSADTRVELQGSIQSIAGASPNQVVTILGVPVNTSTTGFAFEDVNNNVITRAAFFAKAVVGTLVKARGSLSGATVTWSEMEIEDD